MNLKGISVRDDSTSQIVHNITNTAPVKVLDPTLMIDSSFYNGIEADIPSGDYLLIYCFDKLDNDKKDYIISFAAKMNLKIVAFGALLGWEDIYEPLDPKRFLAYFNKSRFVITDTFHGNVFSIIYKKNFVSFGIYKNKVKALLESVGLSDRICTDGARIEDILLNSPSYDEVYRKLDILRADSKDFLYSHLEEL